MGSSAYTWSPGREGEPATPLRAQTSRATDALMGSGSSIAQNRGERKSTGQEA